MEWCEVKWINSKCKTEFTKNLKAEIKKKNKLTKSHKVDLKRVHRYTAT